MLLTYTLNMQIYPNLSQPPSDFEDWKSSHHHHIHKAQLPAFVPGGVWAPCQPPPAAHTHHVLNHLLFRFHDFTQPTTNFQTFFTWVLSDLSTSVLQKQKGQSRALCTTVSSDIKVNDAFQTTMKKQWRNKEKNKDTPITLSFYAQLVHYVTITAPTRLACTCIPYTSSKRELHPEVVHIQLCS